VVRSGTPESTWDRDVVTLAPRPARRLLAVLTVPLAAVLAGCGGDEVSPATAASVSDSSGATSPSAAPKVTRTVLLDPGHNGGNASHASQINKKVPDGRGGTKPCNTTGTATDTGYPEHKFTWDVALRVGELLVANHVNVKLTRTNDTGIGPCVDARGQMAEKVHADAVVSIHADGAAPSGKGFHVAYPRPALNAAQGAPSLALATAVRDGLRGAGLPVSTYLGKDGLAPRSDLAGLNLSKRPAVLVECANMRNPDEAVTVSNAAGRQRYAQAITIGILNWLAQLPPGDASATNWASKRSGTSGSSGSSSSSGSSTSGEAEGSSGSSGGSSKSSGSGDSTRSSGGSSGGSSGTSSSRGPTSATSDPDG
jgi:N-acetylmuramoyl-L-alanine amidase